MVAVVRLHGTDEADVVHTFPQMRQQVADFGPAASPRPKRPGRRQQPARHPFRPQIDFFRPLPGVLENRRFRIEQIEMNRKMTCFAFGAKCVRTDSPAASASSDASKSANAIPPKPSDHDLSKSRLLSMVSRIPKERFHDGSIHKQKLVARQQAVCQ